MSPRIWKDRVRDILEAIEEIQGFIQGIDYNAFQRDPKTIKAIQLDLIVIGEASGDIPDEIKAAHPEIPWQVMRSMRNRLVHVYFAVDARIVWATVQNDLPPLVKPLNDLLACSEY